MKGGFRNYDYQNYQDRKETILQCGIFIENALYPGGYSKKIYKAGQDQGFKDR